MSALALQSEVHLGTANERREFYLLLRCCADRPRLADHLVEHCDWNYFVALAEQHGLVPAVYRRFSEHRPFIPATAWALLQAAYEKSARKSLWFAAELARVQSALRNDGVLALAYKGPTTAEMLYDDVAQRQFSDLDFLVRKSDLAKSRELLCILGYQPALDLNPWQRPSYLRSGYEYVLDHARGRNLLELHWQVQPRFYAIDFNIEEFFERSVEVEVCGYPVRTLCSEDLLFVLCSHAAKHGWTQLSALRDIAQLASRFMLDWNAIRNRADELGMARIVTINFLLAEKLLGAKLPHGARCDNATSEIAAHFSRRLEEDDPFDSVSAECLLYYMKLRERWRDRARFAWRLLATPSISDFRSKDVSAYSVTAPIYRAVRVARLARKLTKISG